MVNRKNVTRETAPRRFGYAAIIGAPNAGKSTLLNQLIGEKLSIVTRKAQTTRMRVLGVLTEGNTQIGLIDTPGIFAPKGRLDKAMVGAAWQALDDADIILVLADAASKAAQEKTDAIIAQLTKQKRRAILVLNKTDKIKLGRLLPLTAHYSTSGVFDEIFMISALTGDGTDKLKEHLFQAMPEAAWLFPEDQLSDLPERLLAAELTREQIFEQLNEELPYSAAVLPEKWEEHKDGSVAIYQTILVQRPNHRAIVLGNKGARIKQIGQAARQEMANALGRKVHLFLDVKADENWQEKNEFYRAFGIEQKS
jgi:GTP-binding protein Era